MWKYSIIIPTYTSLLWADPIRRWGCIYDAAHTRDLLTLIGDPPRLNVYRTPSTIRNILNACGRFQIIIPNAITEDWLTYLMNMTRELPSGRELDEVYSIVMNLTGGR